MAERDDPNKLVRFSNDVRVVTGLGIQELLSLAMTTGQAIQTDLGAGLVSEPQSRIEKYTVGEPLEIQTRWGGIMESSRATAEGDIAVVVPIRANHQEDFTAAMKIVEGITKKECPLGSISHNFYPYVDDGNPHLLEPEVLKVEWYPSNPFK